MDSVAETTWTVDQFLDWAGQQEGRYEFDGIRPVAMNGGTLNHNRIALNIHFALRQRLRDTMCVVLGLDAGVRTVGRTVRYPDAVVTCTPAPGSTRFVPDPVVLLEVVSPSSERLDRFDKPREYAAVSTVLHYVIVESRFAGVTVHARKSGGQVWTTRILMPEDELSLPAIGITVPVADFYENIAFDPAQAATESESQ